MTDCLKMQWFSCTDPIVLYQYNLKVRVFNTHTYMYATGLGVMLVVVVGVGWRCTPPGHEPCHLLFNLGEHSPHAMDRILNDPRQGGQWYGGMCEFMFSGIITNVHVQLLHFLIYPHSS